MATIGSEHGMGPVGSSISSAGISGFLSHVIRPGSFIHKHTYQVLVNAPAGMSATKYDLSYRCESITLPGTNLETSQDNLRKGPSREHAFNMNWQRLCVADQKDGWGVGYFDSYATDMEIRQFDLKGEMQYQCKLFECFPKSIGPETLTLSDTELMRVSVEFVFHRWEQI